MVGSISLIGFHAQYAYGEILGYLSAIGSTDNHMVIKLVVHIASAVVCLPSLTRQVTVACEQVLWTCEPSPAKSPTLRIKAKGVALLIVINFIQRYSLPLTGVIAGECKVYNMLYVNDPLICNVGIKWSILGML